MFTTTETVDLTMLYVREGKNPDSDTSRGTGGKGGIAQMTLFISSSGQEKSPYTVSRSTSLGQAPSCVRLPACSPRWPCMHVHLPLI